MGNTFEVNKKVVTSLLVLLVFVLGFSVASLTDFNILKDDKELDFFNNYVIAVNDYHIAVEYFNAASSNLDTGIWYAEGGDYNYDSVLDFFDKTKEQLTDSKELINHAQLKLNQIKNNTPNEFYEKEIENRLEQIVILLELNNQYFLLTDHMTKQLYEINYGSSTEAKKYNNLYNDLVLEVNINLKKLSIVSQRIDLAWDQDWYALFESVD